MIVEKDARPNTRQRRVARSTVLLSVSKSGIALSSEPGAVGWLKDKLCSISCFGCFIVDGSRIKSGLSSVQSYTVSYNRLFDVQ
jgi:hypothetical protein